MDLKYRLKFAIMESMMAKRKKELFNYTEADLFTLPEGASPIINNSWFFGGDSPDKTSMKMRLGIRSHGMAEVFLIWIGPDGRFLATDKQLYRMEECPIRVENVIPGRDWNVWFNGDVVDMEDGTRHCVDMSFKYIARLPIVHPMYDGSTLGMSQALAKMPWNRKFFTDLAGDTGLGEVDKTIRQVHYEQTGRMEGTISIDGVTAPFSIPGIRDRAFGKRDWNYMDCHVWLVAVTARGEACNVSIVSYPHAKRFFCGYTDIGCDRNFTMVDYKMVSYDHCGGKGPDVMAMDCSFANGKCYRITAHRTHELFTPFDDGNFYFHEGVGDFTFVEIPGLGVAPAEGAPSIKARGTIELGWNKDSSRWGTSEKELLNNE